VGVRHGFELRDWFTINVECTEPSALALYAQHESQNECSLAFVRARSCSLLWVGIRLGLPVDPDSKTSHELGRCHRCAREPIRQAVFAHLSDMQRRRAAPCLVKDLYVLIERGTCAGTQQMREEIRINSSMSLPPTEDTPSNAYAITPIYNNTKRTFRYNTFMLRREQQAASLHSQTRITAL
jgi:hypothetical protein